MSISNPVQVATDLLQHPEVWLHYCAVARQLSPALQIEALNAGSALLEAMKTGNPIRPLPSCWQAMFAVAMNHAAYQTPLFFSDELAVAWTGFAGGMMAYCPRDGYRVPVLIAKCPVCGANTMAIEPAGSEGTNSPADPTTTNIRLT